MTSWAKFCSNMKKPGALTPGYLMFSFLLCAKFGDKPQSKKEVFMQTANLLIDPQESLNGGCLHG